MTHFALAHRAIAVVPATAPSIELLSATAAAER
jgi:hypothetical protein